TQRQQSDRGRDSPPRSNARRGRLMRVVAGTVLCIVLVAACSSKKQPPVASHSPLADSADQVMYGARFVLNDQGLQRAHMNADTAYFFDDNTRIEFENLDITFI